MKNSVKMLKNAQKLTKSFKNSHKPSKTVSKIRESAVLFWKNKPNSPALRPEIRSSKLEILNKDIICWNMNMQNKANLLYALAVVCHSALDAESRVIKRAWMPAFAGMTDSITNLLKHVCKNKPNFALTAGNDESARENSKIPGTFEKINLYYLSAFANSAVNTKQSQFDRYCGKRKSFYYNIL